VTHGLREKAGALRAGPVVVLEHPADADPEPAPPEGRLPGDLVVRTTPDLHLRHGMHVPLLVDLAHLFVIDQHGERICPSPARLPDLEEWER
jgi:multiple sugar transport system ATP-binding protein